MKIFSRGWPIGVIIIAWFIFASPYFLKGLVPFPSKYLVTFFPPWSAVYGMPVKNNAMPDVITQIYPWKRLTIETWRQGKIPLWNPYSFAGTSHAANYQSAVFSPFNLLFFLLPFLTAWSLLVLLQPLLAGIFMYLFLRRLSCSSLASVLGSLAFMFCGFLVVWMAYATLGYAALWLPLSLYAVESFWQKRSRWYLVLMATSLALSFFSGHFQISVYVASLTLAYILFKMWHTQAWGKGILLLVYFILGVILSLPQLAPSLVAYLASVRGEAVMKGEIIPWSYLITILAPDFLGNPVTRNDWFGHYAEWATFIGVVPLMLSLFTLVRRKKPTEWFFWGVALTTILAAFPSPLNDLLYGLKVPVLSTSAASRIVVLLSFSLGVLAAFGQDAIATDWRKGTTKNFWRLTGVIIMILGLIWLGLLAVKILPVDKLVVAKRNFILPTLFLVTGLIGLGSGFFKRVPRGIVMMIIIALAALDLLRFASKWMPFDEREFVYPPMPVISYLTEHVGNARVFGNFGNELAGVFKIQSIEGYDALYQARYGQFIGGASNGLVGPAGRSVVLLGKRGRYAEEALQLLGVKFILQRKSDGRNVWAYPFWEFPHYRLIYQDEHYEIWENQRALPRVFLASSYQQITDGQKIIDALFSQKFNRQETLILEEKPFLLPEGGAGEAQILRYTPNEVVIRVRASVPKLLFLSDVFDPGWRAWVGKTETKIYRADFDFRAVAVPAGEYTVRLVYYPESVRWGLWASAASLLVLLGSIFIRRQAYEDRLL